MCTSFCRWPSELAFWDSSALGATRMSNLLAAQRCNLLLIIIINLCVIGNRKKATTWLECRSAHSHPNHYCILAPGKPQVNHHRHETCSSYPPSRRPSIILTHNVCCLGSAHLRSQHCLKAWNIKNITPQLSPTVMIRSVETYPTLWTASSANKLASKK